MGEIRYGPSGLPEAPTFGGSTGNHVPPDIAFATAPRATDYAGLTWQNAADTLVQKKSGMYLLGLFVSAQFDATKDPADLEKERFGAASRE